MSHFLLQMNMTPFVATLLMNRNEFRNEPQVTLLIINIKLTVLTCSLVSVFKKLNFEAGFFLCLCRENLLEQDGVHLTASRGAGG